MDFSDIGKIVVGGAIGSVVGLALGGVALWTGDVWLSVVLGALAGAAAIWWLD